MTKSRIFQIDIEEVKHKDSGKTYITHIIVEYEHGYEKWYSSYDQLPKTVKAYLENHKPDSIIDPLNYDHETMEVKRYTYINEDILNEWK